MLETCAIIKTGARKVARVRKGMQMMKNARYVLILSMLVTLASPGAWAGFSIMGLANYMGTKTGSTEIKGVNSLGGGLLYEMGSKRGTGLELGALYSPRKLGNGRTFTYIEVPVMLRFHVGPAFSIGVGGYYAMAMGDVKNANGSTVTYAAAGTKSSDLGLAGSVAFAIPMGKTMAFRIDGRYLMGMASINTAGTTSTKWGGFEALVGLQFGGSK
jgi:hypothetical protein